MTILAASPSRLRRPLKAALLSAIARMAALPWALPSTLPSVAGPLFGAWLARPLPVDVANALDAAGLLVVVFFWVTAPVLYHLPPCDAAVP